MKLAIMQPYLFPYIGYFQLIKAVDAWVVYEDVAYKKGGWINRNYLLGRDGPQLFTLPLLGASPNKKINEIKIVSNAKIKILQTIRHCYARAPYFHSIYPLLASIMTSKEENLAIFLVEQLELISEYLGVTSKLMISSKLSGGKDLFGQQRIISICQDLGASEYINLPGGIQLYEGLEFKKKSVQLLFLCPRKITYRQYCKNIFTPKLSIIDVLMFNGLEETKNLLNSFDVRVVYDRQLLA